MMKILGLLSFAILNFLVVDDASHDVEFDTTSLDGTRIVGVIDVPEKEAIGTVLLVPGSGLHDRDLSFSPNDEEQPGLFEFLAEKLNAYGLVVVRYDARGITYSPNDKSTVDHKLAASTTVKSKYEDLNSVYNHVISNGAELPKYTIKPECFVFIGFSEGLHTISHLSLEGIYKPRLVIGLGGLMRSPVAGMRWQQTDRMKEMLLKLDQNSDGEISKEEMELGWPDTWVHDAFPKAEPLRAPFTEKHFRLIDYTTKKTYEFMRKYALALRDDEPYPNAENAIASSAWWKMWFTDNTPVAERLAAWDVPISLHYGSRDSQLKPEIEIKTAHAALGDRVKTTIHPGLGHALGENALYAPMDETAANQIGEEIALSMKQCASNPDNFPLSN